MLLFEELPQGACCMPPPACCMPPPACCMPQPACCKGPTVRQAGSNNTQNRGATVGKYIFFISFPIFFYFSFFVNFLGQEASFEKFAVIAYTVCLQEIFYEIFFKSENKNFRFNLRQLFTDILHRCSLIGLIRNTPTLIRSSFFLYKHILKNGIFQS